MHSAFVGIPLGCTPMMHPSRSTTLAAVQVVVQPCGLRMFVFGAGGSVETGGSERSLVEADGHKIRLSANHDVKKRTIWGYDAWFPIRKIEYLRKPGSKTWNSKNGACGHCVKTSV